MQPQQPELPHDYPDRAIREALHLPANLRALLQRAIPALADRLDYDHMDVVRTSFFLEDWRKRESDLLVKLPLLGVEGRPVLVCILLEHWSAPDRVMPLRMLLYAVLFWEREWFAWAGSHEYAQPLRLTPIVPVVFHTGPNPWNVERQLSELFSGPEEFRVWAPNWPLRMLDLAEMNAAELLASGEPWWQTMAVVHEERADTAEFAAAVETALREMQGLAGTDPVRWQQLAKMILHWAALRRPRREWQQVLAAVRRSQSDAERLREVETMAETIEQTWEQELLARGRAQGEARGQLQAHRGILRALLEDRFGSLPAEWVQRIGVAELPALQTAIHESTRIASLADLHL
jgi:Putative transposase, YhgA-like